MHFKSPLLASFLLFFALSANAWVYPEHRKLALLSMDQLSPAYRLQLEQIWQKARTGYETRLSPGVLVSNQGLKPTQLDYASWSGIAGDHSCSPSDMLHNVLETDWIMKVAGIAAQLEYDLAATDNRSKRINAIRNSDIRFQRADLAYSNRASANNVHFLLARPKEDTDPQTYFTACLTEGAPLNAIGMYTRYHLSALYKAGKSSEIGLSEKEQSAWLLAALADEAYADHFLQDIYAAGHVAGIWGAASIRKGTHDYYNEKGLEIVTWDGKRMILSGDAYLREVEAQKIATYMRASLEQLLDAAAGNLQVVSKGIKALPTNTADSFNTCQEPTMKATEFELSLVIPILMKTPAPGLAEGLGAMPRVSSEIGTFLGVSSSANLHSINGGFAKNQRGTGVVAGLEANVRFGFGLDGVLNNSGDGLVFVQAGWKTDASSTNQFVNDEPTLPTNSLTTAIPGRSAYSFRIRMPFYLIPGDLILASPLLLFAPKTYAKMAMRAGNGGLIPWQSGIATPIGRFQFVLGREIGVSFYGQGNPHDNFLVYEPTLSSSAMLLEYRSVQFDFPILEYRTLRSYASEQSSSLMFQLSAGFDNAKKVSVLLPSTNIKTPELQTVWHIGIRAIFNWRHYL